MFVSNYSVVSLFRGPYISECYLKQTKKTKTKTKQKHENKTTKVKQSKQAKTKTY